MIYLLKKYLLSILLTISSVLCFGQESYYQYNDSLKSRDLDVKSHSAIRLNSNSIDTIALLNASYHWHSKLLKPKSLINYKNKKFAILLNPNINIIYYNSMDNNDYTRILNGGASIHSYYSTKLRGYFSFDNYDNTYRKDIITLIDSNKTIPNFKTYNLSKSNTYRFINYEWFLRYSPSKVFSLEGGQGKHFFGNGYRSMILSDNAANYPYFRVNTKFWNIEYVNLWALMHHEGITNNEEKNQQKYYAMHFLSWNVNKRLNINLSEAIIWQTRDTAGYRGFDPNYLNPIVFYRPTEFSVGSPDNSTMSLGFRYRILKKGFIYGQAFIDDLIVSELRNDLKHSVKQTLSMDDSEGKWGYWTNKQAFQLGFKIYDLFKVNNLYFQSEFNLARPYTYSHRNPTKSFTHYNQALTHPIGANFTELLGIVRYQIKRWAIEGEFMTANIGKDSIGGHSGSNILQSTYDTPDTYQNNLKIKQYQNTLGQGIASKTLFASLIGSYMINPAYNLRIEAGYTLKSELIQGVRNNYSYIFVGLRTSLSSLKFDY